MRRVVLIDANVIISFYLAAHDPRRLIHRVVMAGVRGRYEMRIADETFLEVDRSIARRPGLRRLVPMAVEAELRSILVAASESPAPAMPPIPSICRDPRDDYLIALALENAATHLLTGDRDLLALDGGFAFRIVDAATLAAELGLAPPPA